MSGETVRLETCYGWSVDLTEPQYEAGRRADQGSHYAVFIALREAGVPVRGAPGKYPASQAATALIDPLTKVLAIGGVA